LLLVLGAGYVGSKLAELALSRGEAVVLADNWSATKRSQLAPLEARGARVETADIRSREDGRRLLAEQPDRVCLLAAQASRLRSEREPEYTEQTNLTGTRLVGELAGEAGIPQLVFGSSLHVYGGNLSGEVGPETPYGAQGDLAHLSKIYGEQALAIAAARGGFELSVLRSSTRRSSRRPSSTSSGAWPRPGSSCRSMMAGRRRSASSTSRTRPGRCSRRSRARRTSPPRR
jgi:nucleoside-diphosphate-sugar epimerase